MVMIWVSVSSTDWLVVYYVAPLRPSLCLFIYIIIQSNVLFGHIDSAGSWSGIITDYVFCTSST